MAGCLNFGLLTRYSDGNCSREELLEVETHLSKCQQCRTKVQMLGSEMSAGQNSSQKKTSKTLAQEGNAKQNQNGQDESPTRTVSDSATASGISGRGNVTPLVFENYQILEELPRGGQAVVYKALHIPTRTKVAIKVLLPTLLSSPRARYYFEREAELIARLDHPNIIKIRDSGIIHGQYFFVMEYIEGQPLNRYVTTNNLSFRERIVLFRKVCTAVTYAHQQGIIHRDLKFGNILIDSRAEPHILDFGLAKAADLAEEGDKNAVITMTGQWAGSLSNMSPEQALGKPDLIDARTDVYALGVVLYHLLTGRYPYEINGPIVEVLKSIQNTEPARPVRFIRKFDSDVEAILLTALAKDRNERYQSTAELQRDIENWLAGRPVNVKSISTLYLLRKIVMRHKYITSVAGLLIVIILSFAYISFDLYLSAEKAKMDAEAVAQRWAVNASRYLKMSRQMSFEAFLTAWHKKYYEDAKKISDVISSGSKEKKAIEFLLNPSPSIEKEGAFRRAFSGQYPEFVEFILGEQYLSEGNNSKAFESYKRSYEIITEQLRDNPGQEDGWLKKQVEARLYELSNS